MKSALSLIAALAASPAFAGVEEVVDAHILPGYAALEASAADLRDIAAADCTPDAVRPAWNDTFDAWMAVSHLKFGPIEQDGASVIVAFWPDERSRSRPDHRHGDGDGANLGRGAGHLCVGISAV
jgi:predicted lipoprotein